MRNWILAALAVALFAGPAGAVSLLHTDDGTGNLNSIDTGNVIVTNGGDVTTIGSLGGGFTSVGLAYDGSTDTLYGVDVASDVLLTIDRTTGVATSIGSLGVDLQDAGLAWASDTGTLYLSSQSLYSVDVGTGAATSIGSFGGLNIYGLAFDSSTNTLIGVDDLGAPGSHLYEIDPLTGVPVLNGASLGVTISGAGMAYDPVTDQLYIVDNEVGVSDNFYRVGTGGGSATRIGGLSQQTGSGGLAFVPEPGTGLLLALGLGLLAARGRR